MRYLCFIVALALLASLHPVRADELKHRQATIKGLVVRELEGGKLSGQAVGIVATAGADRPNGAIGIRGTIGKQMTSALDEATRYLRVAHPDLSNADISISFEERYSSKDGGSAGTAFALLARSMLEGFDIDPTVCVTGDIAINGKVMPIGGVTAKLRGAVSDGCKIGVIPAENVPAVGDLMVRGDSMIEILRGIQVFSVGTVDEAVATVRSDRESKLAEAIKIYGELQTDMQKRGVSAIKNKVAQTKLSNVLELAPNHVSAKYALDVSKGQAPRTLTRYGSVSEIFSAAWPFWQVILEKKKDLTRDDLPATTMRDVRNQLSSLKRLTHPDVEKLRASLLTWVETFDTLLNNGGKPISESDMRIVIQRRDALLKELKRLDTDETLLAKMMREGY